MKSIKRESISALLAVLLISFVTGVTPSSVQVQAQTYPPDTPLQSTSNLSRGASSKPATLAELKGRIDEIVRQPALEPGFFAVKIVSLDSGQLIYEQNANKFVRPASNMKLYTVAAAFDRLTPDFHFVTSVYAKEKLEDGKVKGDLIVYGRGDPSIAARLTTATTLKASMISPIASWPRV